MPAVAIDDLLLALFLNAADDILVVHTESTVGLTQRDVADLATRLGVAAPVIAKPTGANPVMRMPTVPLLARSPEARRVYLPQGPGFGPPLPVRSLYYTHHDRAAADQHLGAVAPWVRRISPVGSCVIEMDESSNAPAEVILPDTLAARYVGCVLPGAIGRSSMGVVCMETELTADTVSIQDLWEIGVVPVFGEDWEAEWPTLDAVPPILGRDKVQHDQPTMRAKFAKRQAGASRAELDVRNFTLTEYHAIAAASVLAVNAAEDVPEGKPAMSVLPRDYFVHMGPANQTVKAVRATAKTLLALPDIQRLVTAAEDGEFELVTAMGKSEFLAATRWKKLPIMWLSDDDKEEIMPGVPDPSAEAMLSNEASRRELLSRMAKLIVAEP